MCGGADETASHIVSECKQLAQNEYKKCRHDKIATILHWSMCREYGFPHTEKSYEHSIDKDKKVLENEGVKLLWDFSIQTEGKINHNKPDILLLDKKKSLPRSRACRVLELAAF